jgi:hypothetical protein
MNEPLQRALALGAALAVFALAGCDAPPETPQAAGPTITDVTPAATRISVCQSDSDSVPQAVSRCVTSGVDLQALSDTLLHWGQARDFFSDVLFDTGSFKERYTLREGERECLRRAFCKPMPYAD